MSKVSKLLKFLLYLTTFASLAAAAVLFFNFNDKDCQFSIEGSDDWSRCTFTNIRLACEYPAMSVTGRLPNINSQTNISLNCAWDDITVYLGYASCGVAAFFLVIAEISFSKKPSLVLTIFKTFVAVLAGLSLAATTGFMIVNMIQGRKNTFLYYNQQIINKETNQYFYMLNTLTVVFPLLVISRITGNLWKTYRGETKQRKSSRKTVDATFEMEGHLCGQEKDGYRSLL